MSDLRAFLRDMAATPLEWGRCDCSLMVADWIARQRGVHPAPDLRGRYADEAGAKAFIWDAGGLVALFRPRLAVLGLVETHDPLPGDVAVVRWRGLDFGAIRVKTGWAVKTTRGLVVSFLFEPLVCWSLDG